MTKSINQLKISNLSSQQQFQYYPIQKGEKKDNQVYVSHFDDYLRSTIEIKKCKDAQNFQIISKKNHQYRTALGFYKLELIKDTTIINLENDSRIDDKKNPFQFFDLLLNINSLFYKGKQRHKQNYGIQQSGFKSLKFDSFTISIIHSDQNKKKILCGHLYQKKKQTKLEKLYFEISF